MKNQNMRTPIFSNKCLWTTYPVDSMINFFRKKKQIGKSRKFNRFQIRMKNQLECKMQYKKILKF